MKLPRALSSTVIGAACVAFAVIWLVWLILGHQADFFDLVAVGSGDSGDSLIALTRQGLTRSGPIRFTFSLFMVQVALAGVLVWSGLALMRSWASARSSCLAFGVFAIGAALTDTIGRMFFLTQPTELIKVGSIVMDATVILFALNLAAAMFAPHMRPIRRSK